MSKQTPDLKQLRAELVKETGELQTITVSGYIEELGIDYGEFDFPGVSSLTPAAIELMQELQDDAAQAAILTNMPRIIRTICGTRFQETAERLLNIGLIDGMLIIFSYMDMLFKMREQMEVKSQIVVPEVAKPQVKKLTIPGAQGGKGTAFGV